MTVYADTAAVKLAKPSGDFPYVVSSCPGVDVLANESTVKATLGAFRIQLPGSLKSEEKGATTIH